MPSNRRIPPDSSTTYEASPSDLSQFGEVAATFTDEGSLPGSVGGQGKGNGSRVGLRAPQEYRELLVRRAKGPGALRSPLPSISLVRIDRYVRACLTRRSPPRVSELARYLGVSRGTLTTKIKKLCGTTPGVYLKSKQLAKAKSLLCHHMSINRVAWQAGYGSRRAFFRTFGALMDKTPATYQVEQSVSRRTRRPRAGVQHTVNHK